MRSYIQWRMTKKKTINFDASNFQLWNAIWKLNIYFDWSVDIFQDNHCSIQRIFIMLRKSYSRYVPLNQCFIAFRTRTESVNFENFRWNIECVATKYAKQNTTQNKPEKYLHFTVWVWSVTVETMSHYEYKRILSLDFYYELYTWFDEDSAKWRKLNVFYPT